MNYRKLIKGISLFAVVFLLLGMEVSAKQTPYTHEENFAMDYELKGLFSNCEEYFQVGNWEVKDAKLTLYYKATNLLREELSDFTVSINGEPVYSQRLLLSKGETQKLEIAIPKRLLKEGANSITIESYIRTNEADPCEDDSSTASWMILSKDSYVSVSYQSKATIKGIDDVYKQLTSIEGLENKQSKLFLPTDLTENEMTAAGILLAGISRNAVLYYDNFVLEQADSLSEMKDYSYGVYICEYDKLSSEYKALLSKEEKEAAKTDAVISFVQPNPNQQLLLLTGNNDVALQNGAKLFGNPSYMKQRNSKYRKVSENEKVTTLPVDKQTTQLTDTGRQVKGLFEQRLNFPVTMAANQKIAGGSTLDLRFRYAQNLDFNKSLVTVYVNDTPIGSKKLEKARADGDSLMLDIPKNLQVTGNFSVQVVFQLELLDVYCDANKQNIPWAYVGEESSISLFTEDINYLLFEYYPSPFVINGAFNNVVMVLPKEESKEDLEVMRSTLLTLGRYMTGNEGKLQVVNEKPQNLENANIISVGIYKDNEIAQEINDSMYFSFSPKATTILPNEKMRIEPNYGATLGTAQLFYSPYGTKKQGLLVLSAVTPEGMLQAANYLGKVENTWHTYGDAFVADKESVFSYRFGEDNAKKVFLLDEITKQRDVLILCVIGGCIPFLTALSLIMLARKNKGGK